MTTLLNQVAAGKTKAAFQTYTIQHGIERISVQVPLAEALDFEQKFAALESKTKANLLELLQSVGGKVRT